MLTALRAELDWAGHPTILVVEDVHWADEATLDVLGYLARRIADLPAVLVLTYRDDELTREHPLQQLLGQASASGRVRRLPLRRLSEDAVRWLSAASRVDADEVFAMTSGNPFFVTEVLAAGDGDRVPSTVVDAVLAGCAAWMRPARMRSTSSPRFRPWWSGGWSMPWYRAGWPRWWRPRSTGCSPCRRPRWRSGTSSPGGRWRTRWRWRDGWRCTGGCSTRWSGAGMPTCRASSTTRLRPATPTRSSATGRQRPGRGRRRRPP